MKSTFAVVVFAALAPCLFTFERITAAPPAAPPKAPCKECCEKSCCGEESENTEVAAMSPCGKGQCCNGTGDCPGENQVSVDAYLTLPLPPAAPSSITLAAIPQTCASGTCSHSACAGASPATAAGSTCSEPKTVYYSAIPSGVPSPFVNGPECANPSRLLIAAQPYALNWPLPQPPAPISQASADIIVERPIPYAPIATASPTAEQAGKATQVLFNIQIIHDGEGCLCEYESFREGDCIMFADSSTLLPALRIFEKHNLVRRVSSPKLICTTGHRAQFEIGREVATDESTAWEGVKLEVEAEQLQSGLKVDFAVHTTQEEHTCDVRTAVVLEPGKSIVLKSQGAPSASSKDGGQPVIYVVLTPELIK